MGAIIRVTGILGIHLGHILIMDFIHTILGGIHVLLTDIIQSHMDMVMNIVHTLREILAFKEVGILSVEERDQPLEVLEPDLSMRLVQDQAAEISQCLLQQPLGLNKEVRARRQ